MAGQLDRSRPFSQVVNDTEGRFYEQDGVHYTASGEVWAPAAPATAPAKKKAAAAAADDTPQEPA
jgi:hypothetical protein